MNTLLHGTPEVSLRVTIDYLHINCEKAALRRELAKLKMILSLVKSKAEAMERLTEDPNLGQRICNALHRAIFIVFMLEQQNILMERQLHLRRAFMFHTELNGALIIKRLTVPELQ